MLHSNNRDEVSQHHTDPTAAQSATLWEVTVPSAKIHRAKIFFKIATFNNSAVI